MNQMLTFGCVLTLRAHSIYSGQLNHSILQMEKKMEHYSFTIDTWTYTTVYNTVYAGGLHSGMFYRC